MGSFRDVSNTLSCRTKESRRYKYFTLLFSIYYQMGASENWSSEYFLYSKSSWSRALRVGYMNRRTFVYSFEVVTEYSQHSINDSRL